MYSDLNKVVRSFYVKFENIAALRHVQLQTRNAPATGHGT